PSSASRSSSRRKAAVRSHTRSAAASDGSRAARSILWRPGAAPRRRPPLRAEVKTRSQRASVRVGASHVPARHATATQTTTAPDRTPSVATETAAASAAEAPTPEATSAVAPAPICVAAPAGPIGSAAAAAPAQRERSASGNERAQEQGDRDGADEPAGRYEGPRFGGAAQGRRSGAHPRGPDGRVAADDGDPHRVVEAAGKHDADQGSAAVAGRERKRRGPFLQPEQSSPAQGLERLGEE